MSFALRVQNNLSVTELKSVLSTWENQTTSRVSMDNIKSSRKFAAGWLQFAHPRFINRDNLKKWMVDQADESNVDGRFKLFARGIFESDADKSKRTLTTAIVIDGSLDNVEEFMKWSGIYEGINFIPFQRDEYFTEKEHQTAIKQHNLYLRSLEMDVITIKQPDRIFTNTSGHSGTVTQWIQAQQCEEKKFSSCHKNRHH